MHCTAANSFHLKSHAQSQYCDVFKHCRNSNIRIIYQLVWHNRRKRGLFGCCSLFAQFLRSPIYYNWRVMWCMGIALEIINNLLSDTTILILTGCTCIRKSEAEIRGNLHFNCTCFIYTCTKSAISVNTLIDGRLISQSLGNLYSVGQGLMYAVNNNPI